MWALPVQQKASKMKNLAEIKQNFFWKLEIYLSVEYVIIIVHKKNNSRSRNIKNSNMTWIYLI